MQLGIWGQGCNATEKAAGFTVTKLAREKAPHPAVRFVWPGQYADDATGLVENWNRYYDPSIGRYLQPEPMLSMSEGSPGYRDAFGKQPIFPEERTAHPYAYAHSNPLRFADSDGLATYVASAAVLR